MKKGAILPIALIAFGIVSFLVMVTWAVTPRQRWPWSTNIPAATANTNTTVVACDDDAKRCPDGSTVGRSGPRCEFAACPTPALPNEILYTNVTYGFTLRFPLTWGRLSEYDGRKMAIQNDNGSAGSFGTADDTRAPWFFYNISDRTSGDLLHRGTFDYWRLGQDIEAEETVTWGTTKVKKIRVAEAEVDTYHFEHGDYYYQFTVGEEDPASSLAVLGTLQLSDPDEKLTAVTPPPFKRIERISPLFPGEQSSGYSTVSIMGNRALIGGNSGGLYLYDGKTVKDLSDKIDTNVDGLNPVYIQVRGLANNGKYWLISTVRSGERDHLYRYDGTTWRDISDAYQATQNHNFVGSANKILWTGKEWFFGEYSGRLYRFDGVTYTDLSSLFPASAATRSIEDIDWNGKVLMIVTRTDDNKSAVFTYDGTKITPVTAFAPGSAFNAAGWNGKEWLFGGTSDQHYVRYDGKKATDTGVVSEPFLDIVWLDPYWVASEYLFDGKQVERWTHASRVSDIDLGPTYGLLVDRNGNVIRFEPR